MNGYKVISMLTGAMLLISLSLQAKEVKNFYVNGIDNTEPQAERSAFELEQAFSEKYGHILVNTEVISIYNETQGALDLVESGMQATDLDKFLEGIARLGILNTSKAADFFQRISHNASEDAFMKLLEIDTLLLDNVGRFEPGDPFADIFVEDSISYIENSQIIQPLTGAGSTVDSSQNTLNEIRTVNQLARLLDLGVTATELANLKAIEGVSSIFQDIALARKQYIENYEYYSSQEYQTQQKIRNKFDEVLNNGGAVNIIAHSQGNYFSYEVVSNINLPNNTRLLSIGSPLGVIHDTGKSINLREDMVVRLFNHNIGWNYSNISDNTWNIISNNIPLPTVLIANEFTLRSKNIEVNNDKRGHNFINAYLKPNSEVREAILDTMAKYYLDMGGNTVPRINNIQGNTVCENPLINLVGETQAIQYDVLFYGDKCLFFKDDYLTVFNLENQLVESTYDGTYYSPEHEEYKIFRKFVNNLAIVRGNSGLAREFGLTLNSSGNIGCTIKDNCPHGEITTAQQCENIFAALTGVNPSVMNAQAKYKASYSCRYEFIDKTGYIEYDPKGGFIFVDKYFHIDNITVLFNKVKHRIKHVYNRYPHVNCTWLKKYVFDNYIYDNIGCVHNSENQVFLGIKNIEDEGIVALYDYQDIPNIYQYNYNDVNYNDVINEVNQLRKLRDAILQIDKQYPLILSRNDCEEAYHIFANYATNPRIGYFETNGESICFLNSNEWQFNFNSNTWHIPSIF